MFACFKLIRANLSRLRSGERIEAGGFTFFPRSSGSKIGGYNSLRLEVVYKGKSFFVRMGSHSSLETFSAYEIARKALPSLKLEDTDYRVRLLPCHFLYNPRQSHELAGSKKGFLVSDFFPSDRFVMLEDYINASPGSWDNSPIQKAFSQSRLFLLSHGIYDAIPRNIFVDSKTKTLFFFDLKVDLDS